MRKSLALLAVAATLAGATPGRSDDHLVSREAAGARLLGAATSRAQDRAAVEAVLATPAAERAAAAMGSDLARVRGAVSTLSDGELRDLAARATALGTDPAAGLDRDIHDLLVIFLIVAIVIVVLKAVD